MNSRFLRSFCFLVLCCVLGNVFGSSIVARKGDYELKKVVQKVSHTRIVEASTGASCEEMGRSFSMYPIPRMESLSFEEVTDLAYDFAQSELPDSLPSAPDKRGLLKALACRNLGAIFNGNNDELMKLPKNSVAPAAAKGLYFLHSDNSIFMQKLANAIDIEHPATTFLCKNAKSGFYESGKRPASAKSIKAVIVSFPLCDPIISCAFNDSGYMIYGCKEVRFFVRASGEMILYPSAWDPSRNSQLSCFERFHTLCKK